VATRAGTSTVRIQRAAAQATGTAHIATVGPMTGRYAVFGAQMGTGAGQANRCASVISPYPSGVPAAPRKLATSALMEESHA
jgi:hypothetical protein